MDNVNLERIPLPRFSTYLIYTAVSLFGSAARIIYVLSPRFTNIKKPVVWNNVTNADPSVMQICVDDPWFFWSVINLAYCLIICFGRRLQRVFFGELRAEENTHIRDNLSSFIFYKVVFVYGILNVEALHELLLWAAWFSVLGFLHLLAGLARDRFEFIMQSVEAPLFHAPLLILLCTLLFLGNVLMGVSVAIGTRYSVHLMFFMLAEVFQLVVRTVHVIAWYAVQLYSEVARTVDVNDVYYKSISLYYVELIFSSVADFGDLVHNVHLAFWNRLRVNMSSIIVGMHLQHLFHKLNKRYRHHLRYRQVVDLLDNCLSRRQLPNENCVICWESLNEARELPCCHAFHAACLQLWLERSAYCPTCRLHLAALDSGTLLPPESDQWGAVGTTEASLLSQNSSRTFPSLTQTSSELLDGNEGNTIKVESELENCGSCSSCSAYAHPSNYGSASNPMSAMVNIHRLLDMPNDSHNSNSNVSELNMSTCGSLLPAKFVEALEAELIHYFQPQESSVGRPSHCLAPQSDMSPCPKQVVHSSVEESSPDPAFFAFSGSSIGNSSGLAVMNPRTDSGTVEHVEFPPKRVLRMAIRQLINRVTQAVATARSVGAHVTSLTSSSSDEEPVGSLSPRSSNPKPIHLGRITKTSTDITLTLGKHPDRLHDSGAAVFHSTRALRERSLERRKSAIRNRARQNFLQTKTFTSE